MKTALITGVTGQDGSYLAELLLEKGYRFSFQEFVHPEGAAVLLQITTVFRRKASTQKAQYL